MNSGLDVIAENLINLLLEGTRWILPILAVILVFGCLKSLFRTRTTVSAMAVLVNLLDRNEIPLVNWENSVGRSKQCDIFVDFPVISRNHAVIFKTKEGWTVTDTGSKTGTYINGKRIDKKAPLNTGDTITFGTVSYRFNSYDNFSSSADGLQEGTVKRDERKKQSGGSRG